MSKVKNSVRLKVLKLDTKAIMPTLGTAGAAGFDLSSLEIYNIYPGRTVLVRTGLAFEVPEGYELQIRPRSGMSLKTDLMVANSPGTIDSDYRGEVKIIMRNVSPTRSFKISAGDRIAQAVVSIVPKVSIEEVEELTETERGSEGFGSTGSGINAKGDK